MVIIACTDFEDIHSTMSWDDSQLETPLGKHSRMSCSGAHAMHSALRFIEVGWTNLCGALGCAKLAALQIHYVGTHTFRFINRYKLAMQ